MLISYNWLRDLTDTRSTPLELRERLTMVGLAIDAVEELEGDSVLDVEVPSNRPDCLSHVGIAREVAVIESLDLQRPAGKPAKVAGRGEDLTSVEILDPDLCPRYAARVVRGVKIAHSPPWLAKRLSQIGQRPVNNVADITNYVLHELGQPLHAFDFAKLADQRIVVRRAKQDEKLTTLDGVERTLDNEILVIADAERAVALAGIMGGEDSEISPQTTDVLIESAYFNPDSVRRTARRLGMDTEASRRFERGADRENVLAAQTRCIELICEIAGGVATENAVDIYTRSLPKIRVPLRNSRVESLTSLKVSALEIKGILGRLGFVLEGEASGVLTFAPPSWRVDIECEEDLVEEVARHTGYSKIGSELPPSSLSGEYQAKELQTRALRRSLKTVGFDEAIDFSFIDAAQDDQFELIPEFSSSDDEHGFVALRNPVVEGVSRMRPTLIPGLLDAIRHNLNHGVRDVNLFEIGRVFAVAGRGELPKEQEALTLVATGGSVREGQAQSPRELDFYDLKGALELAVGEMNLGRLRFRRAHPRHLREGQAATIVLPNGTAIGSIGRLSEAIAGAYKFRQPVYVAELDFTLLQAAEPEPVQYHPLPRYPSVMRDLTILVDRAVTLDELVKAIDDRSIEDYRGTQLVGTYEGPTLPEGKLTVTLRIEYRSEEGTLTDEKIEERQRGLIDSLLRKFAAQLH